MVDRDAAHRTEAEREAWLQLFAAFRVELTHAGEQYDHDPLVCVSPDGQVPTP